MKLLAIDTSAHICSACVFDTELQIVLAQESRDIGRGHAEVLMEFVESCLTKSNTTYKELSRVGVTIGPGSFTGVRVGMSVARGFGLSLDIPVIGISTLDVCEASARDLGYQGELVSLLDAKRGELYCKISEQKAVVASYLDITQAISESEVSLCGSGASILNEACQKELPIIHSDTSFDIEFIAKLASQRVESEVAPQPLYLRSADAKIQAGFTLERLGQRA